MFIIASIKNWFLSPSYPNDEEKTLRARLIDVLLVVVIIYVPVLTMVEIITGKTPPSIIIMNIGGILICLLMRHLLRRGYVQDVGSGLIFTGFFWVTWANIQLGTIRTPSASSYILVVILAGALFGWRGTLLSTLASSIVILGLIWVENAGLLPTPNYTVTIAQWVSLTSLFGITGGSTFFAMQRLQSSFDRAKKEIAERKRAEKALQASEANLKEIFETSPDNIFVFDVCADGRFRIKKINAALEKVFNTGRSNIEGKYLGEVLDQKYAELIARNFQQCIKTKSLLNYEEHAELSDRVYSTSLSPILDDAGNVTRLIGISRDITERKQAEIALQTNRKNLEALIENADGSIWSVDSQYRLITGNNFYRNNVRAAIGREVTDGENMIALDVHQDTLTEWKGYYDRALQGERFSIETHTRFHRPSRFMEYRFNPIRAENGRIIGVTIYGRDFTEQKRVVVK